MSNNQLPEEVKNMIKWNTENEAYHFCTGKLINGHIQAEKITNAMIYSATWALTNQQLLDAMGLVKKEEQFIGPGSNTIGISAPPEQKENMEIYLHGERMVPESQLADKTQEIERLKIGLKKAIAVLDSFNIRDMPGNNLIAGVKALISNK